MGVEGRKNRQRNEEGEDKMQRKWKGKREVKNRDDDRNTQIE
jgi:hypothetical protein